MKDDLFYQIALTFIPQIGSVQVKVLLERFGDARNVFREKGFPQAKHIRAFKDFDKVEQELAFIEKHQIKALFLTDPDYPKRLLNCYDPPPVLYYKGNAGLNAARIVAVIGTRLNTHYGRHATEKLVEELAASGVMVVSGLAFGIDAIAHKAALKHQMPTVGVLAHSLDTLYPPEHAGMAREMMVHGGLLTEFCSNTKPDKHNFPRRNRIVAGMSDATIVVETPLKGGSMITAELANNYNRDVFALPGKITDVKSSGCNNLIMNHKAALFSDTRQFIQAMGWDDEKPVRQDPQQSLFVELTEDETRVVDIMKLRENTHIEELSAKTNFSVGTMAGILLNLELQGVIRSLPGSVYQII